jgi:5-methylcytosine-specific restriction endonuclease McrBC regulatory subunit McrC
MMLASDPMPAPRRTLALTERVPHICRLAREDVDYLLAEHRGHVEVTPTRQQHRYRLVAAGHVGVLVTPGCRLVIRPKIPLANLFHLLDPDAELSEAADASTPEPGGEALDFLARRLALRMRDRAASGLHRGYAERAEQGAVLQGRLDLTAQLREGRKEQIHFCHDDLTADVPCNRIPRAAAERLLRSTLVGDAARAELRRALAGYEGVRPVAPGSDAWAAVTPERLPADYAPLLDLCRLLLNGLRPGEEGGEAPGPAFLLDLERAFERYFAAGVVRAFAGTDRGTVRVQPLAAVSRPVAGQDDLTMRPDLLVERGGRAACVVDTKWKRLPRPPLVTADVYQVLAYALAFGAGRAVLVYPGRRDRAWSYELKEAPCTLEVRTLRVVGAADACRRSLARLAREV